MPPRPKRRKRLVLSQRSMADASSTGAEPSSTAPQMEARLTSAALVRWVEQMEVENSRYNGAIEEVNELTAAVSSMRDGVATCAAQLAHLEIAFEKFVDNHADRVLTSRDDGDARERLRQKA